MRELVAPYLRWWAAAARPERALGMAVFATVAVLGGAFLFGEIGRAHV